MRSSSSNCTTDGRVLAVRGEDLVGETVINGLEVGQVRVAGGHQVPEERCPDGPRGRRGRRRNLGRHVVLLVEQVGELAQLGGRADGDTPHLVDHHLRVLRHHPVIAGLSDDRRSRHGDPIDAGHDPGRVSTQRVVNSEPVEHQFAAGRV